MLRGAQGQAPIPLEDPGTDAGGPWRGAVQVAPVRDRGLVQMQAPVSLCAHLEQQRAGAAKSLGGAGACPPPRAAEGHRGTGLQGKENSLSFFRPRCRGRWPPDTRPGCLLRHRGSCDFSGLWQETAGHRERANSTVVARALISQGRWHLRPPVPAVVPGHRLRQPYRPGLKPGLGLSPALGS